jgi:hypothetical protein
MVSSQPEIAAIGLKQRFPMIIKIPESQQVTWEASVPATYLYEGPEATELLYERTGFAVFRF